VYAASEPSRPEPPRYVSSTSTSITLEFDKVEENGGAEISSYKLYTNLTNDGVFVEVTSYDMQSLIWTINAADAPTFNTGTFYSFKVSALNVIGESLQSNSKTMALAMRANAPQKPTVDRSLSSLESLFVRWEQGADGDIPILGTKLYMIELSSGQVTL